MRPAFLAALLATIPAPATAQTRVHVPAPVPPTARAERVDPAIVVSEVRHIIGERYVLPERRPALDAVLAEGLRSGRYRFSEPGALAEAINADLARVGHDRHLNFRYAPELSRMYTAGREEPDEAAYAADSRRRNFGIRELRVLPGNVRYMAYDGFDWTGAESAAALETAMRFLSGGDAVIIDIRRNGGGSPEAVQYLVSHFMQPNIPLMTFYMNGQATPDRTATLAQVPAGRMISKPLYVLTSARTASAAEEFAGHVAGYHLGELIGQNTAGAGFRNMIAPVQGGFLLSVSVGRAVLASTGRDWEAVGHAPTVATTLDTALPTAQARALRRLAGTAAPHDRPRLEAAAAMLEAQVHPVQTALPPQAYVGDFGERIVRLEDGRLTYQRGDGPKMAMIPVGPNAFTFEDDPGTRIEYAVLAGSTTSGFQIIRLNGENETQPRTP